jgi:hypothetical protein
VSETFDRLSMFERKFSRHQVLEVAHTAAVLLIHHSTTGCIKLTFTERQSVDFFGFFAIFLSLPEPTVFFGRLIEKLMKNLKKIKS